jgi:transcriptional regulator GlxA family with amidase domain
MHFQILIFDGFDELDAIAPYEVLQNAVQAKGIGSVELVTVEAAAEITADQGLKVRPSGLLDLKKKPDILIVPGGGWIDRSPRGAFSEAQRGVIPKAIKSLHESGTICAAVCTGAMLLAAAGILKNRPAKIVDARVVDDGNIVTAGGVTSSLDLALWLVERFYGSQLARKIEMQMEYERRGTVWKSAS